MMRTQMLGRFLFRTTKLIERIHGIDIFLLQLIKEFQEDFCSCFRIIHGTVMMRKDHVECLGDGIQSMPTVSGKKCSGKTQGIYRRIIRFDSQAFAILVDKRNIKRNVVSHHDGAFGKVCKTRQNLFNRCRIHDHGIRDTRQFGDFKRNRHFRIYKFGKTLYNFAVFNADRTDFNDAVFCRRKTCCLQIKNNKVRIFQ